MSRLRHVLVGALALTGAVHGTVKAPGPTDATSTHTRDWACIRWFESRDNYRSHSNEPFTGAYQIANLVWHATLRLPGQAWQFSNHVQNRAALRLWHYDLRTWGNPWHAWETAPLCGL